MICFAAKKMIRYVNERNKRILVSVDLLDPINISLYIQDDEGAWRWGKDHCAHNLKYVSENQVVGLKPGKKLFTLVIEKYYGPNPDVLGDILNPVADHAEVYQDGIWHCDFITDGSPPGKYKRCDWQAYDEIKYNSNSNQYLPGAPQIRKDWLHWIDYNAYAHGPIFASNWIQVSWWQWLWCHLIWQGFHLQYSYT